MQVRVAGIDAGKRYGLTVEAVEAVDRRIDDNLYPEFEQLQLRSLLFPRVAAPFTSVRSADGSIYRPLPELPAIPLRAASIRTR
jgi:hypothetical protein